MGDFGLFFVSIRGMTQTILLGPGVGLGDHTYAVATSLTVRKSMQMKVLTMEGSLGKG